MGESARTCTSCGQELDPFTPTFPDWPLPAYCWPCQRAKLIVVPAALFPDDDYDGGLGSGDWIAATEEAREQASWPEEEETDG